MNDQRKPPEPLTLGHKAAFAWVAIAMTGAALKLAGLIG